MFRIQQRILEIAKKFEQVEPSRRHIFLEAGANDGVSQSNTLLLEKRGWDGILVEPSPVAFDALVRSRKCSHMFKCAVGSDEDSELLGAFEGGSLMGSCQVNPAEIGTDKRKLRLMAKRFFAVVAGLKSLCLRNKPSELMKVKASTLSCLIDASKVDQVDILVLDIEGHEIPALLGLKEKHCPRVVAIETWKKDAFEINDLMLSRGYILVENLSMFAPSTHPGWSQDHQDYLWVRSADKGALQAVS